MYIDIDLARSWPHQGVTHREMRQVLILRRERGIATLEMSPPHRVWTGHSLLRQVRPMKCSMESESGEIRHSRTELLGSLVFFRHRQRGRR